CRSPLKVFLWLVAASLALITTTGVIAFSIVLARTEVPTPNDLATTEATVVYYAGGKHEIGRLSDANRRAADLPEVPLHVQQAVLAAEDRGFYEHGGISPWGIARAAVNNVFNSDSGTQGGSTITQQYAKNAFLTQERTWQRKIKEALLAFKLETIVSKDQILEDYLNIAFFGRDAYGIEAAAMAYFNKPIQDITLSEGAVLAAIMNNPGRLNPEENISALRGRWQYVLDGMLAEGWITQAQYDDAQFPEIAKRQAGNRLGGQTGYLLEAVHEELLALGIDETQIQRGGLTVVSTFNRRAQRSAERAVAKFGPESKTKGVRIGLAAVRPGSGEVAAMYGGEDFIDNQINNATRQFAQAGSTFKPFALAAALESDLPLRSYWQGDSPATIKGYELTNYNDKSYGEITLLEATRESVNTAYVEMEDAVGVDRVADAAVRAGIPKRTPGMNMKNLDLTFVLGTASPSAVDMANSYATFAARGERARTTFVRKVVDSNGDVLYRGEPKTKQVFDKDVADTVTYALTDVVSNGTGATARDLGRPAAGKTGTTDMNKSAWFVGFTPQLSTAVFMTKENKDGIPVSLSGTGGREMVTGGSFPAAIWTGFMKGALKKTDVENFPKPPKNKLRGMDCPEFFSPDMDEVPLGCPTPEPLEDPFVDEANPEDPEQREPGEPGDAPAEEPAGEQDGNNDETVSASGPRTDNRDNGRDDRGSGKKKNNDDD
ncbi:MAG TPA: transglycosylase domain-containing protein, partial [Candidatus Nanopelagicales bacterium]|nr:transglycosylase domain-containing protein [Candidatus Nanopelagicales bacterium]